MKVLVLGANGSTGFNVVKQLLIQGIEVKAVTRKVERFESIKNDEQLEVLQASILDIENQVLKEYLHDVDAVISCLGHNLTLQGLFGKPYSLVADALKRIVNSISESDKSIKIIWMNTTACINELQGEKFSGSENLVIKIMRFLLPPQRDNDLALGYLLDTVGTSNHQIEWIAVRPDTLIDEGEVSEYIVHPSPIRSPIFDAGKTSRINVADFMARLLINEELWGKWKYKTPVIYNMESNL